MTSEQKLKAAENEKGDRQEKVGLLEKLGKFSTYTTPAMKGLLFYGEGEVKTAATSS